MAKFRPYYALCPLLDQNSLLGICEDPEPGVVIITLGRNIAITYRISDQKQIRSWRTKDKFTSAIVYDKSIAKYAAVFNHNCIKVWTGDEESLNKVKKHKFPSKIFSLVQCGPSCYVAFENGVIVRLQSLLDNEKELVLDKTVNDSDCIEKIYSAVHQDEAYIGLLLKSSIFKWVKFTETGVISNEFTINMMRDDCTLNSCILHSEDNHLVALSLWSDGRVFRAPLITDVNLPHPGELNTAINQISRKHKIATTSINQNYIVLYGNNCNEEGALVMIYNLQFKVVQCKQSFKMFNENAKIWAINDSYLILPTGQYLAVLPYHLDTEQLAALVGSHKIDDEDPDVAIVSNMVEANWSFSESITTHDSSYKPVENEQINDLIKRGSSESHIIDAVLPQLIVEHKLTDIWYLLENFQDFPEKHIVNLLDFLLKYDGFVENDETNNDYNDLPNSVRPFERIRYVDRVLQLSFTDVLLLPHLRQILGLDEILTLLDYIFFLWQHLTITLPNLNHVETERKLIDWTCVILDCQYQQFSLLSDERINTSVTLLNSLVEKQLNCLTQLELVAPIVELVNKGRTLHKDKHIGSQDYSIEKLELY